MSAEGGEWRYWLALLHAPGIGAVKFRQLLDRYGEPQALFHTPPSSFDSSLQALAAYLRQPDWPAVDRDLAWLQGEGCALVTLHDAAYPPLLRELHDAPPLLFVRGSTALLATPQLAMVGSRNPSSSGRETAHDFACTLSRVGMVITSGLAQGIDAASHQGALQGGGQTIAVTGTGLDRVYPASNRELAHAIVDGGGTLISEFPPGTQPHASNFPRRNRIISGLSLGTLVVEAALRSGSLITARLASEQGREVFAIPGSIHNPLARGCHQLIRQGAKLVESAADVLEELAPQLHAVLAAESSATVAGEVVLDDESRRLLECLGYEATAVDLLVERSGLTAEAVSSMLLPLELQGFVAATVGGYARTTKRL
ncbi:MAG: DNA-processing protein DprA [Gammaproteobacteria bacterium]|nr:DNA-processing protein DprA [Gammaproteobacteria bacterium]